MQAFVFISVRMSTLRNCVNKQFLRVLLWTLVCCYTKKYLSIYNKVVQAILQKGKVIYGKEIKFTRIYGMDVQISYRLHT